MDAGPYTTLLAEAHLGLLSVIASHERPPLITPVWYGYRPGEPLRFSTATGERPLDAVRRENRAAITVHEAPYGVTVEGHVLLYEPADPAELHRWASACLGPRDADRYLHEVEDDLEHMTTVVLRPDRWYAYDLTPGRSPR